MKLIPRRPSWMPPGRGAPTSPGSSAPLLPAQEDRPATSIVDHEIRSATLIRIRAAVRLAASSVVEASIERGERWLNSGSRRVLLPLLAALIIGCGEDPQPGPCLCDVEAWHAAADAWEARIGRLSPQCRAIRQTYTIEVVDDVPCPSPAGLVNGCTLVRSRVIYVRRRDCLGMTDTAVHEWLHVIAACERGDPDSGHATPGLWGPSIDSVETGPRLHGGASNGA
jgi:hypothetical protein